MDTSEKIVHSENLVHGAGGFPAYSILAGFVLAMAGIYASSVIAAVAGTLVLLFAVVRMDYHIYRRPYHSERAHRSSVIRHV